MQVDDDQVTQFLNLLHKHPDAWTDAGVHDVLFAVELYGGGILQCFSIDCAGEGGSEAIAADAAETAGLWL